MDIRKVHLVFKTHLDIGFTDFSAHVIDHYLYHYIPAAIAAAQSLNIPGQAKRFVWTVGSYIIDLAVRTLKGEEAMRLDRAIKNGDITYHALPFTTHSELCSREMFKAGLGIAKRLDERYGKKTCAAKMSDVPGHTLGIVGPLVEMGIEFLHIGINDVARMPAVPALFMWENAQGQQVMVNYARSYGGLTTVEGHDEALYFLHSSDNMGPPDEDYLREIFESIQAQFPQAQVAASTLDAFAIGLRSVRGRLPVLREEIADTWIHGIGTDPKKVAMFKELDRLSQTWDKEGLWENNANPLEDGRLPRAAFLEELLLVCEHTWGMDTKKFLADFVNWSRADFDLARRKNTLKDSYGLGTAYESAFMFGKREFEALKPKNLHWEQRSYSVFEKSHQEQRDYIKKVLEILPQPLRMQAEEKLEKFNNDAVAGLTGEYAKTSAVQMGDYVGMLEDDDIILRSPAGHLIRIGLPIYQEVGLDAYDRLEKHYLWHMEKNRDWAIPDNKKTGAENSDAPHQDIIHKPNLELSAQQDGAWHLEGRFDERPQMLAGCPEGFRLTLKPYDEGIKISLFLYHKPANRK
ncbi:MAG: DUF5054 domain-containing protein, partial [Clostridiales bacterium]|nr:DUF5054 domain-containing protein [Clostridiales bacterium]